MLDSIPVVQVVVIVNIGDGISTRRPTHISQVLI